MKKLVLRIVACLTLVAMLCTTNGVPGLVHVHAAEAPVNPLFAVTEEEMAAGEVLYLTKEDVDANGVLFVKEGTWERVIVPRNLGAKIIYFSKVTVDQLVIEGGMDSDIYVNASHVHEAVVAAPQTGGMSYAAVLEMVEQGAKFADYAGLFVTYITEMAEVKDLVPTLIVSGGTEIAELSVLSNVTLDAVKGTMGEVLIETKDAYGALKVELEGYNGHVEVVQNRAETEGTGNVQLTLTDCALECLHATGESGTLSLSGNDATVKNMEVAGAYKVVTDVDTEKVVLGEDAKNAVVRIYSDVQTVEVKGDENQVAISKSANVGTALVDGDNVKVYGWGALGSAIITGASANVAVYGAEVEGENDPTIPDEMWDMLPPEPTTPEPEPEPEPTPDPNAPHGHVPGAAATCTEAQICTICSATLAPATGHTPSAAATCTTAQSCTVCNEVIAPAKGHILGEGATCTDAQICTVCNEVLETAIGHDYVKGETVAATCETEGYTVYTCKNCQKEEKRDVVAPTGHSVASWAIDTDAASIPVEGKACTYLYTQKGTCATCKSTVTSQIEQVKHTEATAVVTKTATCQTAGTKTYECSVCHATRDVSYTNADAHVWPAEGTQDGNKLVYKCTVDGCTAEKSVIVMTEEGVSTEALDASTEVEVGGGIVMALDETTIENISGDTEEAANVKLAADEADLTDLDLDEDVKAQIGDSTVYDLSMEVDGSAVTSFGEDAYVTVRLPYTLAEDEDPESVCIWFINSEGTPEAIPGTYHDGFVTFKTNHFSYYTVVRLSAAERCAVFGHAMVSRTVNATCTAAGYTTSVCQRCGATETTTTGEATGHKMTSETKKAATCTEDGTLRHYCENERCAYSYEEVITKTGHTLVEEKVDATCTAPGYVKNTCACGYEKKEEIAATGHDIKVEVTKEATCSAYGEEKQTCQNEGCDYSVTKRIAMLEHTLTETERKEADCLNDGYVKSTCSVCGHVKEEALKATGHTAGEDGTCSVCGAALDCEHGFELGWYYTAELAEGATSCEDGVIVSEYCAGCKQLLGSWETYGHSMVNTEAIELSAYVPGCADYISMNSCACGEQTSMEFEFEDYDAWTPVKDEFGEDEEGNQWYNQIIAYGDSGLSLVANMTYTAISVCEGNVAIKLEIHMNDVIQATYDAQYVEDNHDYKTRAIELVEGATNCEEGVLCERYCTICEQTFGEWVNKGHVQNIVETIDFSEYEGTCGGIVEFSFCLCGKSGNVNVNQMSWQHSFTNDWSDYEDENGLEHRVVTYTCTECPVSYTRDRVYSEIVDCEQTVSYEFKFYVGETTVGEYAYTQTQSAHDWVTTKVELAEGSTSCEEGIIVTEVCNSCGLEDVYQSQGWHYTYATESIDLSEYEGACGEVFTLETCACGEENRVSTSYNCWFSWSENSFEDENGNECVERNYSCNNGCATHYTVLYVYEPIEGETCEKKVTTTYTIYFGEECAGELTYSTNEMRHEFETTVELAEGSTTCEDGVIVTNTCAVCGETESYTRYGHYEEVSEVIDLSAYEGACGAVFTLTQCACGEYSDVSRIYECSFSSTNNNYVDENGNECMERTYTCQNCATSYTRLTVYSPIEGETCIQKVDRTYTVYFGEECVGELTESYEQEAHEEEVKCELAEGSNSCEDGVVVTRMCKSCGEELSKETEYYHRTYALDVIDLSQYEGSHGGELGIYTCACGEENGFRDGTPCGTSWEYVESYTDDNGIVHMVEKVTSDCVWSWVSDRAVLEQNGCEQTVDCVYTVYVGEEQVAEFEFTTTEMSHVTTRTGVLAENATSCLDGVIITESCACGEFNNTYTIYTHQTFLEKEVDSEKLEGVCGVLFRQYTCTCGEESRVDKYYVEDACQFTNTGDSYIDEEGRTHWVYTYTCQNCSFWYTRDHLNVKGEGCTDDVTNDYVFYLGEEKLEEMHEQYEQESHNTKRVLLGYAENSTTCEEGVIYQDVCRDCGKEYEARTTTGHTRGVVEEIDFSEYEGLCAGRFVVESCMCGESFWTNYEESKHTFTGKWDDYVDESGIFHEVWTETCSVCGLFGVRDEVTAEGEGCEELVNRVYTFSVGNAVLGTIEYSYVRESHDTYIAEVQLDDGSQTCEDGVRVTGKCYDCDYTEEYFTMGHTRAVVEEIDLADYGAVCGGSIIRKACACGEREDFTVDFLCDTGYSWWDMKWNYYTTVEETETTWLGRAEYDCAVTDPACDFHCVMEKSIEAIDECHDKVQIYLCIDGDGDGECETKIFVEETTQTGHETEWSLEEGTLEDGTATRIETYKCKHCEDYIQTTVFADYLKDESFRYQISEHYFNDDYGWDQVYEYAFAEDGCTYKYTRTYTYGDVYEDEGSACEFDGSNRTCTQYGMDECLMCKNVMLNTDWSPTRHSFGWNSEKGTHICAYCGMESETGNNGSVILEDLSTETDYVAGFWDRNNAVAEVVIFFVTETDEIYADRLKVTRETVYNYSGTASVSKEAVAACAAEDFGLVEGTYDVRMEFVTFEGDTSLAYNITFKESESASSAPEGLVGSLHWANSFDWGENGYANSIFVFASEDATASISSIMGQPVGTYAWFYNLVLEYDETKGVFVVDASDMVMDGVNAAETATLGEGKLAVMFHGDVETNHPDSYEYFTQYASVGTEHYLVGDYQTLVSITGALSGMYFQQENPDTVGEP